MPTQTTQLDSAVVQQLNELQSRRTSLVNTFGQIYVRRQELNEELEKLYELEEEANTSYTNTNKEVNTVLETLRTQYPNGSIDLQAGTITYVTSENE
jgi:uncharacterized coiled-coil DUF342 family protein